MNILGKALLTEVLTYWQVTGLDSFGTNLFAAPILVKGKIFERLEYNNMQDEITIYPSRTIYLDTDVVEGSYLGIGDLTVSANPQVLENCFPIYKVTKISGINLNDSIRKVMI